jgi:hypothetical protein
MKKLIAKILLTAVLTALPISVALANSTELNIVGLENAVITTPDLFIYGEAPNDKLLQIFLKNLETKERHMLWSGYSDYHTNTFTHLIPFSGDGTFDVVAKVLGPNNQVFIEKPFGPITLQQETNATPLEVEAKYKINNSENAQASVFSLSDIAATGAANMFGPSVNLTFEGTTDPKSKVFLLWKNEEQDFVNQSASHSDGSFSIQPLEEVEPGYYTAYLYSQNLETSIVSHFYKTSFNITSDENKNPLSMQALALPLGAILVCSGAAWAYFTMVEEEEILHPQA